MELCSGQHDVIDCSHVGRVRFFGPAKKRNPTKLSCSHVGRVRFFGPAKKRNPTKLSCSHVVM